jgi:hypothetical protein
MNTAIQLEKAPAERPRLVIIKPKKEKVLVSMPPKISPVSTWILVGGLIASGWVAHKRYEWLTLRDGGLVQPTLYASYRWEGFHRSAWPAAQRPPSPTSNTVGV